MNQSIGQIKSQGITRVSRIHYLKTNVWSMAVIAIVVEIFQFCVLDQRLTLSHIQ